MLESEITSLLTTVTGAILTDAWTSVKPRLAVLLRRGGRGQDDHVLAELAELEELRANAASAPGEERDGAAERVEEVLRTLLGTLLAEQSSLAAEVRELRAAASLAEARPLARIAVPSLNDYENNDALLRQMDEAWEAGRTTPGPTVMYVYGSRGVGITALAHQWLLRHRDVFAAGPELSAGMARNAFGELADPLTVLESWFRDLYVPAEELPADPDARVRKFRQVTGEGPVFVLLEDVALASQVEQLLPGSPDSVVLVTSNALLRNLVGRLHAKPFKIEPLGRFHSKRLLVKVGGLAEFETRYAAQIDQVLDVCRGHPLFLRIAGSQMVFDLPHSIDHFATALSDPDRGVGLGAFDVDEHSGAGIFDPVYRHFCDSAPDAALVYRCVGLHPTAEFDADVVRAMTPGLGDTTRERALRALMDANLIERADAGYRTVSGLVHAHAAECARADLPEDERGAVRRRWIQHYVDLAERSDAGLSPRHRHDPAGAYGSYARVAEADQDALVEQLEFRRRTLRIAVRTAYEAQCYDAAWRLPQGMWTFYLRCGFHSDWIETYMVACDAALECGDLLALATMRYGLGYAHLDRWSEALDDPALARDGFEQALDLVRPTPGRLQEAQEEGEGRRRTRSSVLEGMGVLERKLGNHQEALGYFDAAHDALEGIDHPRGRALLDLHRGPVLTALGRHDEAAARLLSARSQFRALPEPDTFNAAKSLARYGDARLAAGHPTEALTAFTEAVSGMDGLRHGHQRAQVLLARGDVLREHGELRQARTDWTEAGALLRRANSSRAQEAARRLADWPDPDGTRT